MQSWLQLAISGATLVGMIIAFYKYFSDPDVKAQQAIALMKQRCEMKSGGIETSINLIKNNHLSHIEKDISDLKSTIVRVETILEVIQKKI